MNPAIGPDATDFDRAGATVAFQRQPGNRSPDVDPAGGFRLSSTAEERALVRADCVSVRATVLISAVSRAIA